MARRREQQRPQNRKAANENVPSVAARVVARKAREREANKILRGNAEIAKQLEKAAASRSRIRNMDVWDQITNLLMREAAAALRQSDRIRPDDLRLEDPAKLFELDQARRVAYERRNPPPRGRPTSRSSLRRAPTRR